MATDSRWWEEYECAMDAHPSSREEAQEIVRAAAKVAGGKHSFLQLAGSVLAYAVQVAGVPQQSRIVCPVAILTDAQTASSGTQKRPWKTLWLGLLAIEYLLIREASRKGWRQGPGGLRGPGFLRCGSQSEGLSG